MDVLNVNEPIAFGANGTARRFLRSGWSSGDDLDGMTWTEGHLAEICFRMSVPRNDMFVELEFDPFVHAGEVPRQQVWIHLNGWFVGYVSASVAATRVAFELRSSWFVTRGNTLTLALPDAVVPSEVGAGRDARRLGLSVRTVTVSDRR